MTLHGTRITLVRDRTAVNLAPRTVDFRHTSATGLLSVAAAQRGHGERSDHKQPERRW
jgi:hypothetical protein